MDKRTENIISFILYISILFTFVLSISFTTDNKVILGILSSIIIVSTSIRSSFIYVGNKAKYWGKFLILIDLSVIYWLLLIDKSSVSVLYTLTILIDAIMFYNSRFSIFIIFISYLSICFNILLQYMILEDYVAMFLYIFLTSGVFGFVCSILYLAKYQILQKQKVISAMEEVEEKTLKLEEAYKKLKEHSEALEEITILEERNRIAREIHDTVGHTLTTVLIEIEAGKRLVQKNEKDKGLEKISLAQEQVRKGLHNIRKSVRLLKEGEELMDFLPSMDLLLKETIKHTDVEIDYNIDISEKLPKEVQKTLYNSLMEGLTNGIKHGGSKKFFFRLYSCENYLNFLLKDQGKGCENVIPGFGLTVMKEQVEKLKGVFSLAPSKEGGCELVIRIPIERCNIDD